MPLHLYLHIKAYIMMKLHPNGETPSNFPDVVRAALDRAIERERMIAEWDEVRQALKDKSSNSI